MALLVTSEIKVKQAIILEERQNLMEQTITVSITNFGESTITGSPRALLGNELLVKKMNKVSLFRLSFLAGIEHEEALERKRKLVRTQKVTCRNRQ